MTDESGNFSVSEGLVLSCGDPNRLSDCQVDANPTGLGGGFTDADLLDVANSVPPLIGQTFTVGLCRMDVSWNLILKLVVTASHSTTCSARMNTSASSTHNTTTFSPSS